MKKSIEINNLFVDDVFDDINLDFYKGHNTYICGSASSGKTTLLKCIKGSIKYKGEITKLNVGVVNSSFVFEKDKVIDEVNFFGLNKGQQELVLKLIGNKMNKDIKEIDDEDKIIVAILRELYKNLDVLCIDNLLSFIDMDKKKILLNYFVKSKTDLVLVSNDIEDALYFDYMIVMNKGKIAVEGDTHEVLKEEKILKRLGVGLPFYVDLSLKLKLYGLIDEVYLNKKDLVGALWK